MFAAWIVAVLIVGRVLATGTMFADRLAAAARRPRRVVWLAGFVATAIWPIVAIALVRLGNDALRRGWEVGWLRRPDHLPLLVVTVPQFAIPESFDRVLFIGWFLATTVLVTRLALRTYATSRWRKTLPLVNVDGVEVRLSRGAGRAVVGGSVVDVVLPLWALSLEPSLRRLVLRHEESHREAGDVYLVLCVALFTALVPWNLFLWWQASRLHLAMEMDCDARVLRADPRPMQYARLLLQIAQATPSGERLSTHLAPALGGRASQLERRIAALDFHPRPLSPFRRATYSFVVAGAVLLALGIRAPSLPRVLRNSEVNRAGMVHLLQ